MKTIRFNIIAHDDKMFSAGYNCTKAGDQSGEYVRAQDVADLLENSKAALKILQVSENYHYTALLLKSAIKKFEAD